MTNQRQPARRPATPTEGAYTASERLGVKVAPKGWAEVDPDIARVFGDTGEELGAVAFEDGCRCHTWFVTADGTHWRATEVPGWDTRRKPAAGERFVVVTLYGEVERVTRYAATRADLKAHIAELGDALRAVAHPRDGAHAYAVAAPLMLDGIRTVDDVLAHLEAIGVRAVRVGAHVALTHPIATPLMLTGGQFHRRPGDPERELVRDWAALIAARLGGPRVGCDVDDCERAADSLAMGGAMICAGHLEAAVGEAAIKPARAGVLGAIASAIGA